MNLILLQKRTLNFFSSSNNTIINQHDRERKKYKHGIFIRLTRVKTIVRTIIILRNEMFVIRPGRAPLPFSSWPARRGFIPLAHWLNGPATLTIRARFYTPPRLTKHNAIFLARLPPPSSFILLVRADVAPVRTYPSK